MKILDVKQSTPEWLFARAGKVTASEWDHILTPLFKAKEGKGVDSFMAKKVAERFLGQPLGLENFEGNFATGQGNAGEGLALGWFNFTYECNAVPVGFIESDDGRVGASPDAVIFDRQEGVEIKCPQPETHTKYLLGGKVPEDHIGQPHFSMYVTGFKKWHYVSWSNRLPKLVVTVERDEKIQDSIREAVDSFYLKFDAALAKLNQLKEQAA